MKEWQIVFLASLATLGCSAQSSKETGQAAKTDIVKITQFYASPGVIAQGESTTLCYGVEGAKQVRLDPPVEDLKPSMNRCFSVSPVTTTRFTLVAQGADGKEVSETLQVAVQGVAKAKPEGSSAEDGPQILFFSATTPAVSPGSPTTICYGVRGATTVEIEPNVGSVRPSERMCVTTTPGPAVYTIKATDSEGRAKVSKVEALTIKQK
jgi:hypothetical protein